jgi:predicted exporter
MNEEDMQKVARLLTPGQIGMKLQEVKNTLNAPEGWILKTFLLEDPLGFHRVGLEKLRYLNMFHGMSLREGHFTSSDGMNVLVIGETPIRITDVKRSKELVGYTLDAIDKHVPRGIVSSFISGHSYTAANAETLKRDLSVILTFAPLIILILLVAFMRNWRAIFVFLVPTTVVCIATAGVMYAYHTISAITIAFGSVLMGISDDYPIYAYFSLRSKKTFGGKTVAEISGPVLASGFTTMATFSALFFSDLPGQRQIAWFSVVGVVASLVFSLVVLPHLLKGLPPRRHASIVPSPSKGPIYRGFLIGGWLILIVLCMWQGSSLKFNGDMRAINMVPQALRTTETGFRETWGDFRGKALITAQGDDLQSALRNNDLIFDHLKKKLPDENIISLSPILPSIATQKENLMNWAVFWDHNKDKLRNLVAREGEKLGFLPHAFDIFFERLSAMPSPITIESLKKMGFGDVIDAMIIQQDNTTQVFTLAPDTPEVSAIFEKPKDTPFVSRFISQRRFSDIMGKAIFHNFIKYIAIASLVIILLLFMLFRNVKKILCALIPVATGLLVMFGIMGLSRIEFNLFNIIASILVIGLSVDLGIFMVSKVSEEYDHNTSMAVLLGGLTSLVGMGALTLASHPALYSLGITVLLGMCGAIPSALFVIPAFYCPVTNRT